MILLKKFNIMIWFILIYVITLYVITLILFGVYIYIDMNKGETLQNYFNGTDLFSVIFCIFIPIINTFMLTFFFIYKLSEKV